MFGAFRSIRNVIFKTNIIYHDYETAFDRTINGVLKMTLLKMLQFLVLTVVHQYILIVIKISSRYYAKETPMILVEVLLQQKRCLILVSVNQKQNFVWVYIKMVMEVIYMWIKDRFITLPVLINLLLTNLIRKSI